MEFRIADTLTDSLARLANRERQVLEYGLLR